MNGQAELYDRLKELNIDFEYYEHPPLPTVEVAMEHWSKIPGSTHCKNIFLRNHKGNQHYLVIIECSQTVSIRDLELRLKQGKLSFASEERLYKYLKIRPGSVSPFGLINDTEHHVKLFLDKHLLESEKLSFHPNENTASLVVKTTDLIKFLDVCGNPYEFTELY